MTEMERIFKTIPSVAPFEIEMADNSINEVWTDIPTKMKGNQAWHIVGVEYAIEPLDPATTGPGNSLPSGSSARLLQIHRNDNNELLLRMTDMELMYMDRREFRFVTAAGISAAMESIERHMFQTITTADKIRALFRTDVDDTAISSSAWVLRGLIHYHIISAPSDGRTKHGDQLRDL